MFRRELIEVKNLLVKVVILSKETNLFDLGDMLACFQESLDYFEQLLAIKKEKSTDRTSTANKI